MPLSYTDSDGPMIVAIHSVSLSPTSDALNTVTRKDELSH